MSIREDEYLPTFEELETQELNVSTPILRAGSVYLGKKCQAENNEYMLCKKETNDPRKCLKEGKAVTDCALGFFQAVKQSCCGEFVQYVNCLDRSSPNFDFAPCRNTQAVFDKCMKDNLDMDRPEFDTFAKVQVHKAIRPRPEEEPKCQWKDPTGYLPEGTERPAAKYGARYLFSW